MLSILFLRFAELQRLAFRRYLTSFNSLFEIHETYIEEPKIKEILDTFNSLFEIPRNTSGLHRPSGITAFNSLFEIRGREDDHNTTEAPV